VIRGILFWVLFCFSLFGGTIKVAVAANMSYALPEIIKAFYEKHPNVKVETLLGSSGKLFAQIKNGAPFDLFLSANMKYPNALYNEKLCITKPKVYATGSLALLSSQKKDFSKGIKLLQNKDIKKIALANPKTAPYGKAAVEAMKRFGIFDNVKNKFVFAQSVAQATTYSIIAADIGFVAKSTLFSRHMKRYKKDINWIEIDPALYTPIKQGIVLLKDKKEAREFYDFIFSETAKKILKSYGYNIK
jgi:molybdate transport system substrate-binding protein